MPSRVDSLLEHIGALEHELEHELAQARRAWRYRVVKGRVRFAREVRLAHERLKQSIPGFIRESSLASIVTAPIIYSMVVPIGLLDLWITIYQHACFRIYGIALVPRAKYVIVDRHHLAYLNGIEKLNCMYCSYANGIFAYTREIGARTEQYWCPIRHAQRVRAPHAHYRDFVDYGDADGYKRRLPMLREQLTSTDEGKDARSR